MLKTWLLNGSLHDIEIGEEFNKFVQETQEDQYTTITLMQLEQLYGTSEDAQLFINELTKGTLTSTCLESALQHMSEITRSVVT